jgi:hypothetical protein
MLERGRYTVKKSFLSLCFLALVVEVVQFGCGRQQPLAPSVEQTPVAKLAKPAGRRPPLGWADVFVTVIRDGKPVEGVIVEFSRSISGLPPAYLWGRATDKNGQAMVHIETDLQKFRSVGATGYYRAKATDFADKIIGQWGSIPINDGGRVGFILEVGKQARFVLPASLDEDTLERLTIETGFSDLIQMQPGQTHIFVIGINEGFSILFGVTPVYAQITWSINPTEGAHIDPHNGVFTVDEATPNGAVFTVSANVEQGRRVISTKVHVFTPEANPLVGLWSEEVRFACGTGEEVVPKERVGELVFYADGSFAVTWAGFEFYQDYWGTYTYDLEKGSLKLVVTRGNYVPKDVDGIGTFSLDAKGRLILRDIWLGSSQFGAGIVTCGHRFTRRGLQSP